MLPTASQAQEPQPSPLRRLQRSLASAVALAANFFERHALILPAILFAFFGVAVWTGSLHKQLWHDELITYLIAEAPDWHTLLHWTQTLDLNPPLSFALTRLSLHAFGTSAEAGRLPFTLGIVVCGAALFRTLFFLTRSAVWSALGLALVLEQYEQYAIEMRPYAIQAALLALAVLAWQRIAADRKTRSAKLMPAAILALCLAGGMLSHLFFVLLWAAFCFAEAFRAFSRRSFDPVTAIALLLPLSVVGIYRPIFAMHAASFFPQKYQPKLLVVPWFYVDNGRHILWLLLPGTALILLLWGIRGKPAAQPAASFTGLLTTPFAALLAALGAIPGLLILYLHIKHGAFFWRYGFVLGYVYAVLFPLAAFWLWRGSRGTALLLLAGVFFLFGDAPTVAHALRHPSTAFQREPRPKCAPCGLAAADYPTLPLVAASGLTFVEMNERESPATLANIYFVVGRDEAIEYAHATIFEGIPAEHDAFGYRGPVLPYSAFIASHDEFLVFGTKDSPEQWLLRKLAADGAQETLLRTFQTSGYGDAELWHVVLPPVPANSRRPHL